MKPTKQGLNPASVTDINYSSGIPYGATVDITCQDVVKCVDTTDADCVIYTGPDISAQGTVVVNTDDSVAIAIQNVVDYFATNGSGIPGAQGDSSHVPSSTDSLEDSSGIPAR